MVDFVFENELVVFFLFANCVLSFSLLIELRIAASFFSSSSSDLCGSVSHFGPSVVLQVYLLRVPNHVHSPALLEGKLMFVNAAVDLFLPRYLALGIIT